MTSADLTRARFLDELEASAKVLASVDSAAVAEAWASGAVDEWLELGGRPERLAVEVAERDHLAGTLLTWFVAGDGAAIGPIGSGQPTWWDDIGTHELAGVVELDFETPGQRAGAEIAYILSYVAKSGDAHDLSVTLSAKDSDRSVITSVTVGPAGLGEAATDDDLQGFRTVPVDAQVALDTIAAALAQPTDSLSPEAHVSLPLLARRLGSRLLPVFADDSETVELVPREPEDDAYAAEVVVSALRPLFAEPQPDFDSVLEDVGRRLAAGDADAISVAEVAAVDPDAPVTIDVLLDLVGAYFAPATLTPHPVTEGQALAELEPADWIGVILGLARSAPGTEVDGQALVTMINRVPEITTTVPARDAPRIGWAFEAMLYSWVLTGVLKDDGTVSPLARWLLPQAAVRAWTGESQLA